MASPSHVQPCTREGAPAGRILAAGRNCWRLTHAHRVAFLVDAAAYFDAFAAAVERAERSILIVGWDIDSRLRLRPDDSTSEALGRLLDRVICERPELHAHVVDWDWSMLYALEREALPRLKLGWRTHRHLHFRLDKDHPGGGSHHQKIAVVDDRVAFVGGLDLTARRWDTPEHHAEDPRRIDPWGKPYGPFHDVQMVVDGEAAGALGQLIRQRWQRLTGREVPEPEATGDAWPPGVRPDIEDVEVGIARTEPRWRDRAEVREIERLYLDAIAAARRFIYVETQYLTSVRIGEALAERLAERDGPEVVIVTTLECTGWLEQATMGLLRDRLLRRLRAADRHGRLRVFYPTVPALGDGFLKVHSKVLVVDDRLVRIGSSNLNNRSMGLDSECDLAIEANGSSEIKEAAAGLRCRLLGEHLGVSPERVAEAHRASGSLTLAVDRLRGSERTLVPLESQASPWVDDVLPAAVVADPERPIAPRELVDEILGSDVGDSAHRPLLRGALVVLAAVLCGAAWRFGPLADWLPPERLAAWADPLRENPLAPALVVAAYVLAGFAVFPVTVLIFVTILVFGAGVGLLYAMLGSVASAAATYAVGRALGRDAVQRFGGSRLEKFGREVARRGFLAVAVVRAVPIAPFTLVNIAAGAMRIPFRPYLVGTVVGMAPGMLALSAFGAELTRALGNPSVVSLALLIGVGVLLLAGNFWLRRRLAVAEETADACSRGSTNG